LSDSPLITLEIAVDRANEKWVFIAREMLSTLHDTVYAKWVKIEFFAKKPIFHFFIVHRDGRIRFFLETSSRYHRFLESQLYAHYPDIEITEVELPIDPDRSYHIQEARLSELSKNTLKLYVNLKDRTEKESIDPLSSITAALTKCKRDEIGFVRIDFVPLRNKLWRTGTAKKIMENSHIPVMIKSWLLAHWSWIRFIVFPVVAIMYLSSFLIPSGGDAETKPEHKWDDKDGKNETKTDTYGYGTRIIVGAESHSGDIVSSFSIFNNPKWAKINFSRARIEKYRDIPENFSLTRNILSTTELAGMIHLPTIYVKTPGVNWVVTRKFEPPHNLPSPAEPNTPIGMSNFRGSIEGFGIQPIDRARHVYIIGKTGMGKSTLLENMLYSDIMNGRGVGLIDPHGDLADTILANIPKSRTNDIVLFDPSDTEYPIAFNMLDNPRPELRPIVASGLVSIFKKMFAESWGPRLEYILRNTILTLLLIPDTTLISIPLMLTHESFRRKIVAKIDDPILIQFWTQEFEKMAPAQMSEAINPILNKVGQFLSSPILRNILGQPKNPFSLRWIMDNEKIFIVNLSKGKIGEDASALLGAMMVTKFQIEAMTRADIPESERKDFWLYVDEFQNFATDSFATILSEARKYKLSLTMANQYIEQMPETVQGAVFGNVGSLVGFQVGYHDASVLADIFGGEDVITPQDLTNLAKYDIYTKLLIDGMPSPVFSATTLAPIHSRIDVPAQQSRDVLLKVSREKYTKKREFVEKKIFDYASKITEDEKKYRKEQEEYKERIKEEKKKERENKNI
jgi:Type IV secretion-system coupling protein DNA-binding domain